MSKSMNGERALRDENPNHEPLQWMIGSWLGTIVTIGHIFFWKSHKDTEVESKEVLINCMVPAKYPGHYRWPEFGRDEICYWPKVAKREAQVTTAHPATNHCDIFQFEDKKRNVRLDWVCYILNLNRSPIQVICLYFD